VRLAARLVKLEKARGLGLCGLCFGPDGALRIRQVFFSDDDGPEPTHELCERCGQPVPSLLVHVEIVEATPDGGVRPVGGKTP
jgi:hypothetical protein